MLRWVRIAALGVAVGLGGHFAGILLGDLSPSGFRSALQLIALLVMVGGTLTVLVALLGLAIAVVFRQD